MKSLYPLQSYYQLLPQSMQFVVVSKQGRDSLWLR